LSLFSRRTLKPGAYFVSVGRSTVTADLIAALNSGKLAGARLDVVDPEPLPSDSPLWHLPNLIITPHVSADTPLADERRVAVLRENLPGRLRLRIVWAIASHKRPSSSRSPCRHSTTCR
jgi:phosphoglycerate dehydrogenase-like enzyme